MKKFIIVLLSMYCVVIVSNCANRNTYMYSEERLYSAQMHLHGPFGGQVRASMSGHNAMAERVGIDVIWWTDHDWRVALHSYISGWDFESEGLKGTIAVPKNNPLIVGKANMEDVGIEMRQVSGEGKFTIFDVATSRDEAISGQRSLKYHLATTEDDFQETKYQLWTARWREGRGLALGISTKLSVRLDTPLTEDVQIIIKFELSDQLPDFKTELNYVIATELTAEMKNAADRKQIYILLDYRPGEWNTYTFPLTEDAKKYGLGGEDGCLNRLYIGMKVRDGETIAYFDDYRIEEEIPGSAAYEKEREMAASFTKVRNYLGQEISYSSPHMNAFGPNVPLIDFQRYPQGLMAWERVNFVHRHGGIIALNHPGSSVRSNTSTLFDIVMSRAFGADLIEVRQPRQSSLRGPSSYQEIWDACSLNKVYITGFGTSDSHNHNTGWLEGHNFVTWIYARSIEQEDLMEGLLRGRAFTGDPALFHGTLDLDTPEGYRMGNVVLTEKDQHEVTLSIEGLEEKEHRIKVIVNGMDSDSIQWDQKNVNKTFIVDTTEDTFIRAEVFLGDRLILMSNPIYFTRLLPAGGVSPFRLVISKEEI